MKQYFTLSACSLLLVLTGCAHKQQAVNQVPLAPPVEDAPLPKPDKAPTELPPTVVSTPPPPATTAATQPPAQPKPAQKKKKPKPQSTSTQQATGTTPSTNAPATPATPPANNEQASNGSEVSAIGQLSTGAAGGDARTEIENSLTGTEHGLNTINRKLSDDEEKTAAQIREYIKQSRTALTTNDLDGARNLATKAKLLLTELTQQ